MKKILSVILLLAVCVVGSAQSLEERYRSFQRSARKTYTDFRAEANARYAKMLEGKWEQHSADSTIKPPVREIDPPVYYEEPPQGEQEEQKESEMIHYDLYTASYDTVVAQPDPLSVILENRRPTETVDIVFYGTPLSFRAPKMVELKLTNLRDKKQYSAAWQTLSGEDFDNLLFDCLAARDKYQLCDYAYLKMLEALSEKLYGKSNEAVFLKAFLYTQSGYLMKLAYSSSDNRLFMFFASNHTLYNCKIIVDGDMNYYLLDDDAPDNFFLSPFSFSAQQQPMSMQINYDQRLSEDSIKSLTLASKMGITSSVNINEHLIEFYNNYPKASINDDILSTYGIYANAPIEKSIRQTLYPALKKSVSGYSERDAIDKVLNFVQTAFDYKLDEEIWGSDRVFFPLETLYYPYCDCEDRSILFSRLVRDLFGNDVVLVHYPGHLATAVRFESEVHGDFLMVDGQKYVVCDPAYIGAHVGASQPRYKGETAINIIKLQ